MPPLRGWGPPLKPPRAGLMTPTIQVRPLSVTARIAHGKDGHPCLYSGLDAV